jgi:DNA-binding transcriptional LysR family regulator
MLNQIDLTRIDLNLLVLFEAVFQERHVTRTAERLNLSPSAVSHGLGRLRRLLNDPLFIRTPKGVVPNDRAMLLAPAVADILQNIRALIGAADPFDPATSTRRFVIGAPDGVSAVFLQPLMTAIQKSAPGIDLSLRDLLPAYGEPEPQRAWRHAFASLEAGALTIAVLPVDNAPVRFAQGKLYEEDFVLAMRTGHPFALMPTLEAYCESQHLVVSESGDPTGFVDQILAAQGKSRRVALTAPNFMFACAVLKETDLICAIPRHFAMRYAHRFDVTVVEAPIDFGHFWLNTFLPAAALADAGVGWLLRELMQTSSSLRGTQ